MIDFDDRDLVAHAVAAGFCEVNLTLELRTGPEPSTVSDFEVLLESSPNPLSPTLRKSIDRALSPAEATTFINHMREAVASSVPLRRTAGAYLVARRSG